MIVLNVLQTELVVLFILLVLFLITAKLSITKNGNYWITISFFVGGLFVCIAADFLLKLIDYICLGKM